MVEGYKNEKEVYYGKKEDIRKFLDMNKIWEKIILEPCSSRVVIIAQEEPTSKLTNVTESVA